MKKIHLLKCLLTLLSVTLINFILQAQNFKLIDVNKIKNSDPYNYQFSSKNMFAELKGVFYFGADDGIHGTELYSSDGTTEGTVLVKDINQGTASSTPVDIIASGDKIYFSASDSANAQKIWVSDGTDEGTQALDVLPSGVIYSYTQFLTDVNGTLYFNYNYLDSNYVSYYQIWKSDGTAQGTVLVANLYGNIQQMTNVSDKLFFTAYNYSTNTGLELYTSNGTEAGTALVKDINPNYNTGSNPSHLTALNGVLYFSANDGSGTELWVSDGTAEGTHAVKNENNIYLPEGYPYQADPFAVKSNTLYFQGYAFDSSTSTATGNELCKYSIVKTSNNVMLVKDIIPGEKSSYPSFITDVNGTLYFTVGPDSADAQLWKSDGTKSGTVLVKDINPGGQNYYYGLTDVSGTLLFAYGNDSLGTELWKSNGTNAGTVLVKDIFHGAAGSYPRYITYKNGVFLFGASSSKGGELWRSDGTTAGTVMVKDINHTSTSSSVPYGFTATAKNKTIFTAYDGKSPGNLFVTDGTNAGTKSVESSSYAQQLSTAGQEFINFKGETYFIDFSNRLNKTDGTKAGTLVLPIPAFVSSQNEYITNFAATENLLYIFVYNYSTGFTSLWRTDGTADGTYVLKSDLSYYYYSYPTPVGSTLFFAAFDYNTYTSVLMKSDGTIGGTSIVKSTGTSNPLANLYNFNGKLYFSAYTPTNTFGPSLWTSDGTDAGTKVVKEVALIQEPFAQANGKIFFYALDAITKGYELFASNGTYSGTNIVKDINAGVASSAVFSLVSGDTLVYFLANDGKHGEELWKSNGTSAGTKLVKDITPGINGTTYNFMVNAHNNLFFTVNDTLWQSDGTKGDTHPVQDDNLKGVSGIYNLTAIGDSLYFSGYTYHSGQELYVGSAEIKAPVVVLTIQDSIVTYTAPARIRLHAAATDEEGTITKVEFYNGTSLLHTEHEIPYGFLWTDVQAGSYKLTAKATDNSGNVRTSNSINISVTAAGIPAAVSDRPTFAISKTDINSALSLKLSPNPADNILKIYAYGLQQNKLVTISVISVAGVVIKMMESNSSPHLIELNVSSLVSGLYTIKIVNGDKVIYKQFVKL